MCHKLPTFAQNKKLRTLYRLPFLIFLLCLVQKAFAISPSKEENTKKVFVRSIQFHGNKITKENIILREMNIAPGDSILVEDVELILEFNKRRILNIQLVF